MRAFKFFYDIKFLTVGEGQGVTFNCLLYATKQQKHVEDTVILYLKGQEDVEINLLYEMDSKRLASCNALH
jgi:hypothetical protein